MKFVLIVVLVGLFAANAAFAHQTLNKGYFLYNNVSVGSGDRIVVGVNVTSDVGLLVLPSRDFNSFINGGNYTVNYNKTVGTGIYLINTSAGNYSVIFDALNPTSVEVGTLVAPVNGGSLINLNGKYVYNFTISNYSKVFVSLLAAGDYSINPISVNISGSSLVVKNDTNLDTLNLSENAGAYKMSIFGSGVKQLFIFVRSVPALVNPLLAVSNNQNFSIGVASYGLINKSGVLLPYQITTDRVVGVANIISISAFTQNPSAGASVSGSGLQLNVMLNTRVNNKQRQFWLQDVVDFNTSSNQYYLVDNIWNDSTPSANLSARDVLGYGNLTTCSTCNNQKFYAYSYPTYYFNYTVPLTIYLVTFENQTRFGTSVLFGYRIFQNGILGPLYFFDRVVIPNSDNSTLLTTPYYQTPGGNKESGSYYDSELVFAGESSGANAQFDRLNSSLWIYYDKGGVLTPFPSAYTFGLNTAETVTGIKTVAGTDGATVTTGNDNLSGVVIATSALSEIAKVISNNTTGVGALNLTSTAVPQTGPKTTISKQNISTFEVVAAISIVLIFVLGFWLLRKR